MQADYKIMNKYSGDILYSSLTGSLVPDQFNFTILHFRNVYFENWVCLYSKRLAI